MPTYRHGKKIEPLLFKVFQKAIQNAKRYLPLEELAYLILVYWTGLRVSELLSLIKNDLELKNGTLFIKVRKRLKHGAQTPPLELSRKLPFMDLVIQHLWRVRPTQRVFTFTRQTAWNLCKEVYDGTFYNHYFRLNRCTQLLEDPETTVPECMAWFGWRSSKTVDSYIGLSRRYIKNQSRRLMREVKAPS